MKKKYSDPLMFASRSILTTIPVNPSQSGHITPDDEWDDDDGTNSIFSVNSAFEAPAIEEPVTIVNPVEEAATSFTTESAGESITTSPLEVAPVIDEIVPEGTEDAATSAGTVN